MAVTLTVNPERLWRTSLYIPPAAPVEHLELMDVGEASLPAGSAGTSSRSCLFAVDRSLSPSVHVYLLLRRASSPVSAF